ncbi:MAG: anhydro-N-acetylmuramic acid kinase [Bacteroidales bacterium]|nr:anhydro-N-acetylmuramic acid kinase [Bacteroidales bacterium]
MRMTKKGYHVVGLMSGTSLDGLDLALCRFYKYRDQWTYEILHAGTDAYSEEWKKTLSTAGMLQAREFLMLHKSYGNYLGSAVKRFLGTSFSAGLVASHGHTIFHRPEAGLTFQLGDGATLASVCGITTVSDFRTISVAVGGQGAPLVPVGDELLFGAYDGCLNLGGFANISYRQGNRRVAFDICPVNIVLNKLALLKNLDYDTDGHLGRTGRPHRELIRQLNFLPYYEQKGPKSLGREWLDQYFLPVLDRFELTPEDKLRCVYEHIFHQIGRCLKSIMLPRILVTGGGAFNGFLIGGLKKQGFRLELPDRELIKYKEALIFAFLGLLRYRNEVNCLASVAGGRQDLSAGIIHRI